MATTGTMGTMMIDERELRAHCARFVTDLDAVAHAELAALAEELGLDRGLAARPRAEPVPRERVARPSPAGRSYYGSSTRADERRTREVLEARP